MYFLKFVYVLFRLVVNKQADDETKSTTWLLSEDENMLLWVHSTQFISCTLLDVLWYVFPVSNTRFRCRLTNKIKHMLADKCSRVYIRVNQPWRVLTRPTWSVLKTFLKEGFNSFVAVCCTGINRRRLGTLDNYRKYS